MNQTRIWLRYGFVALVLIIVAGVIWAARDPLTPYMFGLFIFYMVLPVVRRMETYIPPGSRFGAYRRPISTLVVAVLLVAGAGLLVLVLGAPIVSRTGDLLQDIPVFWDSLIGENETLGEWYIEVVPEGIRNSINSNLPTIGEASATGLAAALNWLFNITGSLLSSLSALVLVPLFVIYMLLEEPRQQSIIRNTVPSSWRGDTDAVVHLFDETFGAYVRGVVLESLIVGAITGAGFWLIGVEYWLPLGVIAVIGEIIPILGPWLAFGVSSLVILATQPELFIFAAMIFGVVQALEGWFLAPRIVGGSVEFSNAQTILLLAIGGSVGGFIGMVFVLPITALFREVVRYVDRRIAGSSPAEALARRDVGDKPLSADEAASS